MATVVKVRGSAYRRPGARMLMAAGRTAGMISGGCLENDACERGREVIATGKPMLVTYDSTAPDDIVFGLSPGCNGIVQVLIEPLIAGDETGLLAFFAACVSRRQAGRVATVAEGGVLAFGSTPFDTPVVKTVTITNTQTSPFTTGPLTIGGVSAPGGYSLGGFPATALANGASTTFNVTLSATGTGLFNAPLTFSGNDSFNPALATGLQNQHAIQLAGLVTDTADHWRTQNFGPAATNSGDAADLANPTGDGIANLLKYSLGLNPQVAYPPGTANAANLDPAGFLKMTVAKNPAATDVTLAIEVTGDLSTPTSWNVGGATIDQDTITILKARDNTPISSAQSRYIRLKVTRP